MKKFKAYTYYLYHIPTGKKYYGYRFANNCDPEHDLWNVYFSSSNLVRELIEKYGKESFRTEIRKTFNTKEEAFEWEDKVLRRLKVAESVVWLNQVHSRGPFYNKTGNTGLSGTKWYHNPTTNRDILLHPHETVPEGFVLGRSKTITDKTSASLNQWKREHLGWNSGKNHSLFGKKQSLNPMFGTKRPDLIARNKEGRKPVKTPLGNFDCAETASIAHGCKRSKIKYRCRKRIFGFEYI